MSAFNIFKAFLSDRKIELLLGDEPPTTLDALVHLSYDMLKDDDIRSIANEAVKTRDLKLLSGDAENEPGALLQSWADILDAVRYETQLRRGKGNNH